MNQTSQIAQKFFLELNTHKSGELLQVMDIYTMIKLISFGRRMIVEALNECADAVRSGDGILATSIIRDTITIKQNLSALDRAYKMAMN
jgi:hypothetical protein